METKSKNIFKRMLNGLKELFNPKKTEESKPLEVTPESEQDKNRRIMVSADSEKKSAIESLQIDISSEDGDNNIISKIPTHLMVLSAIYYKYGSIHAEVKAKDCEIKTAAKAEATIITEHIQSVVNGRVDGLDHQIKALEQKKKLLNEELDICQEHRKQLLDYANDNESQFSLWRGIMYVFFGFLLLLSDLPLSLSVVSKYGLITSFNPNAGFMDKIKNVEAMLFSFGIAFCTILIKILYDEYINTRLGRWALELRKFEEHERKAVNIERLTKLSIKLIILLGLLTMLYYSGIFREAGLTGGTKPGRFISFMLFTVIIPTVSGICLSIGLNNLSNINSLKRSVENLEKIQQNFDKISEKQRKLVIKHSQLKVFEKEWNNHIHKIETISDQLVSNYNQGYKNSYLSKHGYDFYNQIQEFHGEIINKKFKKNYETL